MPLHLTKEHHLKTAQYYPALKRLSYWVTNQAKQTLHNIETVEQARMALWEVATGFREIVQVLEILPNTKI